MLISTLFMEVVLYPVDNQNIGYKILLIVFKIKQTCRLP